MSSFLRKVGRRKKSKVLGEVEVMDREQYQELDLDAKVALIQELIPLGLMHVAEVLEQEVEALAGGWYERKGGEAAGVRYGSNNGSVPRLAAIGGVVEQVIFSQRPRKTGRCVNEVKTSDVAVNLQLIDPVLAAVSRLPDLTVVVTDPAQVGVEKLHVVAAGRHRGVG